MGAPPFPSEVSRRERNKRAKETDCVAEDVVQCEPVSAPANREIYREFCRFGLYSAVFASNLEVNSEGYRPNYLLNRTGDFSHGTGKFLDRTGEPAKAKRHDGLWRVGIRQDCT
jgi:hypothetical protein